MNYIIDHIPRTTLHNRRPGVPMKPEFITIHSTGNPSSTARNERGWLTNPSNTRTASWHICVDEKEAVEAIPLTEVAWHAGDGNGQGEGAEREITEIGSDATGLDKHVIFVDARDVEDSDDLPARGETKLAEHKKVISFQSEIWPHGPFEYENDWNIGDIVTVQNKDWGITMDARITEVTEVYEPNGFKLNATFGNTLPTLSQKIKSAMDNWR